MSPDEILTLLTTIETAIESNISELQSSLALVRNEKARYLAPPVVGKRLDVPWLSQMGETANFAPGDCGTADVAMLVNWRGKPITVDQVSKSIKATPFKLLSFADLILAALHFGVTLSYQHDMTIAQMIAEIDSGKPVLTLVNYQSIPTALRSDSQYNAGHYLLVVGYDADHVVYHDPYWPSAAGGAFKAMTRAEFESAYSTVAPGNSYARHALRMD